jgi:simple sugar transport system substrate-binding protein
MRTFTKLMAASALALGLAAPAMAQDDPLQVGFVFVGPIDDQGWNTGHYHGVEEVMEHFGDAVEISYVENVPEGADAERVLTQMALSGADLIFTTSFGYMEPTNNVAERFPNVHFEHATGYLRNTPNVSTYAARFYEGRAVMGHIAGHMTETNIIGYIASYPIPEVIRGINSTYLHAAAVNPDVQMRVVWAYTWMDPTLEREAAMLDGTKKTGDMERLLFNLIVAGNPHFPCYHEAGQTFTTDRRQRHHEMSRNSFQHTG